MSNRLRVSILGLNYAPEPTGIAPYTTGMAHFLADAGHDVQVVTGLPHYPHWRVAEGFRSGTTEWDRNVRVTRVAHPVPENPTGKSRIMMEAAFAARATRAVQPTPDVVLAVSPALLTVGAALRWKATGRTAVGVVTQDLYGRAIAETGCMGGRAARAADTLERSLLGRADGVVAIHESFRRSLMGLGVRENRITTIRNWTHLKGASGDPVALRRELGWRDGEIIVLHAGNMGTKQGLENVINAARMAEQRGLPVRFVLLGTGNQRTHLEELGRGVSTLQFLNPLPGDKFETAMAAADVLVLNEKPGVEEMCVPSKLTSYFASGRPVVAATSPKSAATSEVEVSGGGVCVEPGNAHELVEAVLRLDKDQEEGLAMGLRGQLFARDALAGDAARTAYVQWVEHLAENVLGPSIPTQRTSARRRTARSAVVPAAAVRERAS